MPNRLAFCSGDGILVSMWIRRLDRVAAQLVELGYRRSAARRLSAAGTLLRLDAGAVLCEEGEHGTQAFLLLKGEAEVHLADHQVMVGAGDVVGELATLDPHRRRNATVVAAGPIEVLVYDVRTFRSLAEVDDLRSRLVPERAAA
jgi:CRP-like cAMP-binding protein